MSNRDTFFLKKHVQYFIVFLWLSIVFHLYIFWLAQIPLMNFLQNKNTAKTIKITNVIIETKSEQNQTSHEALISDKNNINQSLTNDKTKEEIYNFANSNPSESLGKDGKTSYIKENSKIIEENIKEVFQKITSGKKLVKNKAKQKNADGGGEPSPSKIEIDKPEIINLYNTGPANIATQSKEYAEYLISMQKKIEKYHREFFPIYQYYQGLLKDGQVIVEYSLDKEGNVQNPTIVSSYGSDVVDKASLNSIIFAKNFGELPPELAEQKEIRIRFHFIYMSR